MLGPMIGFQNSFIGSYAGSADSKWLLLWRQSLKIGVNAKGVYNGRPIMLLSRGCMEENENMRGII